MHRREFIASTMAIAAGASLGVPHPATATTTAAPATPARVQSYRELGKTGMKISDISFGGGKIPAGSLMLRAIDRGINYFDTAPDYGPSEDYIGEALQRFKGRDKIYIASKYCQAGTYQAGKSHLQLGSKKEEFIAAVESSLKRMHTDYLDVVFVHAMGEGKDLEEERKRLLDDNMLAATAQLKRDGKVRALAVSSHGPHHMETLMLDAVRSGHYDVIMPAFNFVKFPKVPEVLKEAHARGVGVVAMKTLAGANDMHLDAQGGVFEQAAFKWVLQHQEVAGLVVTIKGVDELDKFLPASGQPLATSDRQVLDRYLAAFNQEYCRTGCGDCAGSCPAGVDIPTILRYQMYFANYRDEKRAMESYAQLPVTAAGCGNCTTQTCAGACPHGLQLDQKLRIAHRQLSFNLATV